MAYSVGNSTPANYANTSSGKVTNVVADDGLGGSGVVTDVTDRVALSFTVDTNIQFLTIDVTSLAGYVAGITDVTVTVNAGVYVYGTQTNRFNITAPTGLSTLDASMQIIGGAAGDTIKLVNNGNIVGFGGDGSGTYRFQTGCCCCTYSPSVNNPTPGNAALSFITPGITLSIENNGYIAGGGGGGGGGSPSGASIGGYVPGGGGGAGGGISGPVGSVSGGDSGGNLTVRAMPPNAGNNGITSAAPNTVTAIQGGGGGFVLPGTGGASAGTAVQGVGGGGGAGGGGAASSTVLRTFDNTGGSANNAAPTPTLFASTVQGGGGGGWGAAGAAGYSDSAPFQLGAVGGNSIVTNGNAYTLTGSGALYGSVNTALRSVVYTFPTTVETGTDLNLTTLPGFTAGTNVVLIVPANVRLTSNTSVTSALFISRTGVSNPSSVRLIINGAILGAGGRGGSESTTPTAGGNALTFQSGIATTAIVENTIGYIAGGGGGGGRSQNTGVTIFPYGGGGAGLGGSSGVVGDQAYNAGVASGVASGTNGSIVISGSTYASGGSGGTILPGVSTNNTGTFTAGTYTGLGGQAGGSGAFNTTGTVTNPANRGGGFGISGGATTGATYSSGGGGGGWGGSGGAGRRGSTLIQAGQAPGVTVRSPSGTVPVFVTNPANFAGSVG